MCLIYADYVFCLNKIFTLFPSTIFLQCAWFFFLSLANYVQFILYVNILTDILKLVFGMLFMFV